MIPQIIMISLVLIGLLINANMHGKEAGKYNFWRVLLSIIINTLILYYGGFYDPLLK